MRRTFIVFTVLLLAFGLSATVIGATVLETDAAPTELLVHGEHGLESLLPLSAIDIAIAQITSSYVVELCTPEENLPCLLRGCRCLNIDGDPYCLDCI